MEANLVISRLLDFNKRPEKPVAIAVLRFTVLFEILTVCILFCVHYFQISSELNSWDCQQRLAETASGKCGVSLENLIEIEMGKL